MRLYSKVEVRRCRPLLGTYVEITVGGLDEERLQSAVNDAFTAIGKIERLMNIHRADSEVALLNREAAHRPITVSRETFAVLRQGDRLAAESDGAFDYTIAPTLAHWSLLPEHLNRKYAGNWRDVLLLRDRQVYFLQPLAIDLGGIAKGFAVDTAVKILGQHGIRSAVVNAGGDLRAFGPRPTEVHLRHPSAPQTSAHRLRISNSALATSSPCFTERDWCGQRVSHLVNPGNRTAVTGGVSVTVRARECWLADALTKVVLNSPERAEKLLAKYRAQAFVLTA